MGLSFQTLIPSHTQTSHRKVVVSYNYAVRSGYEINTYLALARY